MKCENCSKDHEGSFGSGRFCSRTCSSSFSTKNSRIDINKKVSSKLSGRKLSKSHIESLKKYYKENPRTWKCKTRVANEEIFVKNSTYQRSTAKIRIIEESILPYVCVECGNKGSYNNKPLVLQLDHINGHNMDHRLENLRFLCPNCHTQTETYAGRNTCKNSR